MKKQVFKENTVRQIIGRLFVLVVMFVLTTIFLTDYSLLYWAINIFTFIIFFSYIVFEKHKTIICDAVGCRVEKKRFWEGYAKGVSFNWYQVRETSFYFSEDYTIFYIETGEMKVEIFLSDFSLDEFECFIRTVNDATPHLPYIWEQGKDWLSKVRGVNGYVKVARY